jgi:hypothetical protein
MRRLLRVLPFMFMPAGAFAQGAVIETPAELRDARDPTEHRGTLPERADVSDTVPPPRAQADTSTCTSWGTTYGAASQALRRAGRPKTLTLSPAFTYNQVSGDPACRAGTSISNTLELLRTTGGLPIEEFVYDAGWCGRQPTPAQRARAQEFRISGWSRFRARDLDTVKAQLARGAPVIFSMRIGGRMRGHRGDGVIESDSAPIYGHTMLVVGYDDAKKAFRIQNSWGREWGERGYAWFSYEFWTRSVETAFVID